jgi:type IV pilus assembly protein PilZ
MHDLRRFPRVPLGRPVEFSTKDDDLPVRMEGMGRDISLGGMFIETDLAAPTGANIQVHVTLPGAKHELTLPSIVRWSAKDGMGVQFGLLGARETHAITEFVKTKDSTP